MKKVVYLYKSGNLKRKDNSLVLESKDKDDYIPIEQVDMIIIDNAGEKQDINVQKVISKAIRRREKKYITQIEEAKELLETVDKIWD